MKRDSTHAREPTPYAELHCLSNFSFLRGASHPAEIVETATKLGYAALAITDRNSLAGVVRAHLAAKEHGLPLIIGAELTPLDAPPLVLLAPHRTAYARLARLITRGRLRAIKGDCHLSLTDIAELGPGSGLIAIALADTPPESSSPSQGEGRVRVENSQHPPLCDSAPEPASGDDADSRTASPTPCPLPKREKGSAPPPASPTVRPHIPTSPHSHVPTSPRPLSAYRDIFGPDLYLAAELDHGTPDDERLAQLAARAHAAGLPLVAANAVHYHAPHRRYLQDVLTCIREKCTLTTAGTRLFANAERHLRPRNEIARRYAHHPELLRRTCELAQRCTFNLDELRYTYPHELVPPGTTPADYLAQLTWTGARTRYPAGLPDHVRRQIEQELHLIAELQYEHYFLTVWDIVRFARSRNILCQGRGSAANSAVCYCLGVTAVDPARIDVLFERFVSRERNEPPDIDVDFEHERREEVFQYIYEKYGRERAAITAEVITYRPRSAIRDVGKALGLSLDRIDALAKSVDWWSRDAVPDEALRAAGLDATDRTVRMLIRLVQQLLSFPRHLSQHVGGFVITETPLCEIVPLENGALPGRTFIEWDKDDIDALGILKVDCLALGMLTAIGKCLGLLSTLGESRGEESGTTGLRDQGIEGLRNHATEEAGSLELQARQSAAPPAASPPAAAPKTLEGPPSFDHATSLPNAHEERERYASQQHISRSCGLAKSNRTCKGHLQTDTVPAARGTFRSHVSNASRSHIDPKQHSRGQCASDDTRLPAIPRDRPRLPGGTGHATDHRQRTRASERHQVDYGSSSGSESHVTSPDRQPPGKTSPDVSHPPPLWPLDPSIPQSLDPSIPRPADSSNPQSLTDIPPEDPAVYDMICAADTVGVFQIESRAQMSMLPRLKPRCFYDLVIEVAIVRPGPIQGGMIHPYLRRRNGQEPATYPSPAIRSVLAKTLGVPLFQEQVMRLAVVAAGFTPGQADQLRRSMAAWRRGGQIEKFQVQLMKGLLANGYTPQYAEELYKQLRGFGEYGFPESHAASFALLVYASAWLKRYHPAAFTAALLNSQPMGFYAPAQLVRDAQRHDVLVRPVDVNHSQYDCTLETSPAPALRLGLRLVRGLSAAKVRGLETARHAGPLTSLLQLAQRDDVSRETLLRLAAADAFQSLKLTRRQALWQILALHDNPPPLFGNLELDEPPASLPPMPLDEVVVQDYDALGLSLNAHPIGLLRSALDNLRVRPNEQLKTARHRQKVAVAGIVTHRQRPGTAKGIVFMTLEDETGQANLIIRPRVWERCRAVGQSKIALIAEGTVERQGAVIHVQVNRLHDLSTRLAPVRTRSRDFR